MLKKICEEAASFNLLWKIRVQVPSSNKMKYLDNFELKFYEITKIILYVRNGLARLRRNWNHQIDSWHELNRKHFSNNLERSSIAGYFSSADNVYFCVSARISVVPKIVRFAGKFGVVRYRYAALPLCYVYWTHTHVYTKSSSQSARISSVERVLFFFFCDHCFANAVSCCWWWCRRIAAAVAASERVLKTQQIDRTRSKQ